MIQDLTLKFGNKNYQTELIIVIPIYNEAENISNVLNEWIREFEYLDIKYQFILINDGSNDKTLDILLGFEELNPDKFLIINKINSGHGRSIRIGYDFSVMISGNDIHQVLLRQDQPKP